MGDAPDTEYGPYGEQICLEYYEQIMPTMFFSNGITVVIVVVNVILKKTTIYLVTWIGYDTHSEIMTKITNGVLLVLFFNTGILMLIVNANLSEVSGTLGHIFDGQYYDYSPTWYAKIGNTLVHTMLLNAFMPIIFEALECVLRWLEIAYDSRMWCQCGKRSHERYYSTKKKQIYGLIELYAGPDYIIHFKYSGILNVTYVTMMYGIGLPLLFPIALLSYFIYWAVERYQVAYTYKLPPQMDSRMTVNAMRLISYVPILFLVNSYWMLSNRQIFENVTNKLELLNTEMESSHTWATLFQLKPSTPILLVCFVVIVIAFVRTALPYYMKKWGFTISANSLEVDENLPDFFDALKMSDKQWFKSENKYMKN